MDARAKRRLAITAAVAATATGLYLQHLPARERAARQARCDSAVGAVNLAEVNVSVIEQDSTVGTPEDLAQNAANAVAAMRKHPECFRPNTSGARYAGDLSGLIYAESCSATDAYACSPATNVPTVMPPSIAAAPPGATFLCRDYTWSYAFHSQGACSWHGGIYEVVPYMVHRAVEVLYTDGRWYPGILDRWRRCDQRGWIGHVWWREGVGLQHVEWIKAERLRPA